MERKFYSIACLFRVWDSFHYIMQKTKQGGDVVYMSMEMFSVKDTQPCRCIRYYLCIRYFRSKLNTSVCPEILCTIDLHDKQQFKYGTINEIVTCKSYENL